MERKIGEVFKHNSKVYQCLMSGTCADCDLNTDSIDCMEISEVRGACVGSLKSDKTPVIFKELKKIGDPMEFCNGYYLQKYNLAKSNPVLQEHNLNMFTDETKTVLYAIIKQNEGMEEKKIQHYDCFFDKKEKDKLNLKPFDLNAAKLGKPIYTRDGRKARIVCFDAKGDYPIIALIDNITTEINLHYTLDGKAHEYTESDYDLMMLPEKREGDTVINKDDISDIDWEQRRFDIAKSCINGILGNDAGLKKNCIDIPTNVAEMAVAFADALIAELKKGGEK